MGSSVNGHRETIPLVGFVASNRDGPSARDANVLRVGLLGGFRVERFGVARPVSGWHRRTAKTLTKLLATYPSHALHREQILEILWPEADLESALNSFGKALYAARRAFEPELLPRQSSAYLRLTDSMLALNTNNVVIDADDFQHLAERALGQGDVAGYESALAAYGGELLPEDRYEDWCAERRDFFSGLQVRLLLELAEALEKRGAYSTSADRFREVLHHDPTREDVHRRLMVLYAETGARDQAVRQFHACHDVLQRRLGLEPEKATVTLYQDILANRIPRRLPVPERDREVVTTRQPPAAERAVDAPFAGRDAVLHRLGEELTRADGGTGRLILVSGEAGVGKTRLVAELAGEARRRGASVLWGGSGAHANHLAYGPFAVALEGYVASLPDAERDELARRYPSLVHFVPSLGASDPLPPLADRPGDDHLYLVLAIVRLLSDLARTRPVVLVLGDLHDLHRSSLDLLQYLAQLAARRRWLIVGTFRPEALGVGSETWAVVEAAMRERFCLHVGLPRLARPDCDEFVRAMLPGGCVTRAALDHVYAWSLGNPLCAEELVRAMQERCELVLRDGCWHAASSPSDRVPARVRALVAMNVAPMEPSVRRVLALAAAGDLEISLTDLRAGAAALQPPVSDPALFEALDRALELRILEERHGAYAFRHPLVRSAVYQELSTHRRDQLHAALGRSTAETRCVPA
jgi:DNA-binding SARP family transcriptional activator